MAETTDYRIHYVIAPAELHCPAVALCGKIGPNFCCTKTTASYVTCEECLRCLEEKADG